jgi:hypothetical protein
MRSRPTATIEDLRQAIDCLPRHTRIAMLKGIDANDIIVGAYTSTDGICPMLAAHRAGGRTSVIAFAKAWDGFAFRDARSARARRATRRELLVLKSHLEASLLDEDVPVTELAAARREHQELVDARTSVSRLLERLESEVQQVSVRAPQPAPEAAAGMQARRAATHRPPSEPALRG